ncbi:MAG: glucokinase [Methylobacter sp.]|nr:MAG: glucokinase [Methylobacter sp.]
MILAGDIGATKTVLALYEKPFLGELKTVREQTFPSRNFIEFDDILAAFLPQDCKLRSACFGVAGAVVNQRCQTTNLPWLLDGELLKAKLGTDKVWLMNDLEAMALGMLHLPSQEFIELNPYAAPQAGTIAVIAAGTGLGEAILFWDGSRYHTLATEGGHCDLAPQNAEQDKLLLYLRNKFPDHVSYERVLSGIGFSNLYDFICDTGIAAPSPAVPAQPDQEVDRNAVISSLGVAGENEACVKTVRLFVELYGAEAGNLALKSLALGGVFIGGGIAPKIRPVMESGLFMQAFTAKGRFDHLLGRLPVKLALNPSAPLIGASYYFEH